METIVTKEVPLKLPPMMNNTERFNFLLEEKDLRIKDRPDHKYRHEIRVVKITRA